MRNHEISSCGHIIRDATFVIGSTGIMLVLAIVVPCSALLIAFFLPPGQSGLATPKQNLVVWIVVSLVALAEIAGGFGLVRNYYKLLRRLKAEALLWYLLGTIFAVIPLVAFIWHMRHGLYSW